MKRITELKFKGVKKKAVIFGTGPSVPGVCLDKLLGREFKWFEINKMRLPYFFDYSLYYDKIWMNYFNDNSVKDGREIIDEPPEITPLGVIKSDPHMIIGVGSDLIEVTTTTVSGC